ncbi:hypothetical protein [Tenacibaculum aiptasiae]|uniref:hypothetical protein n=1 Tax=Tenacibaculum aiptasiae TaxID=426481 RepID=UPI001587FAEF|nr:hypothetical protein [Tenacibaculum aiptasiae]
MKSLLKVVVLIFVLGFISCTDNKKIVPENGTTELQQINKEDASNPNNDGGEDPDDTEG